MLPAPKAFVFDWDNTLINSWDMIHDVMNYVLQKYRNETWTMEQIRSSTHHSAKDNFPRLFGEQAEEVLNDFRDYAYRVHPEYLNKIMPLPGALELLEFLKEQEIPCTIVSNKSADRLRLEVTHLDWDHYFKAVYGSTDFPYDKPNPYPAERAFEANNIEACHTWFVGDTPADWDCARNSGSHPIAVGDLLHEYPYPKTHFLTLNELLDYLKV